MTTRRNVLAGLATTGLMPAFGWASVGSPVAISAARLPGGADALVGLTDGGALAFTLALPSRGHAAATHPLQAEVVAFARRPGTFAKVIECTSGRVVQTLAAREGRHFYGHGAFSKDGQLLFTTENH
ncbi:MAG: DUF1513 domain-containing protein, partial [Pseudomonadota bacterium]